MYDLIPTILISTMLVIMAIVGYLDPEKKKLAAGACTAYVCYVVTLHLMTYFTTLEYPWDKLFTFQAVSIYFKFVVAFTIMALYAVENYFIKENFSHKN
jgi:NADH:ubiquinone oxidoreductase subunit 2 (subunit N)